MEEQVRHRSRSRSERHEEESRVEEFYWLLDSITEYTLYTILVFTPWAFGTTETWLINTVNIMNYLLGVLLALKWGIRVFGGFRPARWDDAGAGAGRRSAIWFTGPLFVLTVIMVGYCALAGWNARADFLPEEQRFEYFEKSIPWLPRSYDRSATWDAFRMYLAAACFFWSLRDWLITRTRREVWSQKKDPKATFVGPEASVSGISEGETRFPVRLKRLCWVIIMNGAILAFEGTIQRLSGTRELLWMVRPLWNDTADAQFGPFNYRSNGAQYLNLIWPLCLGFWWSLHQKKAEKFGEGEEFILLPCFAMMIAAPIIASSRGGIAVVIAEVLAAMAIFAVAYRRAAWKLAIASGVLIFIVASSAWLQRDFLVKRLEENSLNTMSGRTEIYRNSRKIAEEYPVWGTGPGTFGAIYQLYRETPEQLWYAYTHNDFLQTLVTFGTVGLCLLVLMLALVPAYWFAARGIPASGFFVAFLWVAMLGCLLHARFDFPLQIYSILLMFLTNCAILTTVARQ